MFKKKQKPETPAAPRDDPIVTLVKPAVPLKSNILYEPSEDYPAPSTPVGGPSRAPTFSDSPVDALREKLPTALTMSYEITAPPAIQSPPVPSIASRRPLPPTASSITTTPTVNTGASGSNINMDARFDTTASPPSAMYTKVQKPGSQQAPRKSQDTPTTEPQQPPMSKPAIYSFGRDDADAVLLAPHVEIGVYLFRTAKGGTFAMSMKVGPSEVTHFQINKNLDGQLEFGGTKHATLLELEKFLLRHQKAGLSLMRKRFE